MFAHCFFPFPLFSHILYFSGKSLISILVLVSKVTLIQWGKRMLILVDDLLYPNSSHPPCLSVLLCTPFALAVYSLVFCLEITSIKKMFIDTSFKSKLSASSRCLAPCKYFCLNSSCDTDLSQPSTYVPHTRI